VRDPCRAAPAPHRPQEERARRDRQKKEGRVPPRVLAEPDVLSRYREERRREQRLAPREELRAERVERRDAEHAERDRGSPQRGRRVAKEVDGELRRDRVEDMLVLRLVGPGDLADAAMLEPLLRQDLVEPELVAQAGEPDRERDGQNEKSRRGC